MQELVDATLLKKVETSIERNKSLQMLDIDIEDGGVMDTVFKGARGNISLKKLAMCRHHLHSDKEHLKAAAAELRHVRPQLELCVLT